MLDKRGIKHQVLNAKHHKREAEIVAQAGRKAAVTIATNMAGRGTDIILGGNAETMAWAQLQDKYATRLDVPQDEWHNLVTEIETRENMKAEGQEVKELGGLHIIGTERHEARRIDLQLRGRCGRQGDPGSSRFYLSLEDDLMRIFAGEWVKNLLTRLGMQEGEAIESRMVSRRIEGAQKKVEERNFEVRKNLLEYDEVMDEQRKRVYSYRQRILDGVNCRDLITEMIDREVDEHFKRFLAPTYGTESFAAAAGNLLHVQLAAKDYRNTEYKDAEQIAVDEASRMAESQVLDAIEENLPGEEEQSNGTGRRSPRTANTRWGLNLRDRDLKKFGRENVAEELIKLAHEAIARTDLSSCARYLEPDYGMRTACAWLHDKFGVELSPDEVRDLEPAKFTELAHKRAIAAYDQRESEYPVLAGLYRFSAQGSAGSGKVSFARTSSNGPSAGSMPSLASTTSRTSSAKKFAQCWSSTANEATSGPRRSPPKLSSASSSSLPASRSSAATLGAVTGQNGKLNDLTTWLKSTCNANITSEELARLDREAASAQSFASRRRPLPPRNAADGAGAAAANSRQQLERAPAGDGPFEVQRRLARLRPGRSQGRVQARRHAAVRRLWGSIGNYVTDLIFKMEQLDEGFVGSTWVEGAAIKEDARPVSEIEQQQQAAIAGTEADKKLEPIRNMGPKVGRNDPCPCGSGKKYKQCCMRST